MTGRSLGLQDDCIQCGESREAVKASQRRKEPLLCATVDYFGEIGDEWERHKFVWTKKDQDDEDRREAALESHIKKMLGETLGSSPADW